MHNIPDYVVDALRDSQDSRVKEYVSEIEWQKKGREILPFERDSNWIHAHVQWKGYGCSCGFPTRDLAKRWAETVQRPSLASERARAAHCERFGSD